MSDLKRQIAHDLADARRRTHELLRPVDDERLMAQHDPLLSPLAWDYGHIGVFEELWLVQRLSGAAPSDEELLHTYNAIDNPRHTRRRLELMDRERTLVYLAEVRQRALSLLEEADLESADPLLHDGFVYDMIVQHEHQHDETILQTLQLLPGGYLTRLPTGPAGGRGGPEMVVVPAGRYPVGSDAHQPYDNEHPAHEVELAGFAIDRFPVSNRDYLRFIEDGGYAREELWSPQGWEWILTFATEAPEYWSRSEDGGWQVNRFGQTVRVEPDRPVMHVCWFEADAYARWAGKRLPTEQEWEVAATWDPATSRARRHPWGDREATTKLANLDQWLFGPAPVGAYPEGASPLGCEQMLGDVWEWTASDFVAYPGF
ncbi:MAG TPA: SUMF1/EgtB/PvdO family nonheme iron enzyme, partial [Candidatus Dormibacteraeota bacterium]|nr:SUMF1/EgtB/PvdO family nonheme iron enzyme [Candidatus Dormibacteraeota bacterium]